MAKRKKIECDKCHGTGKVELCMLCEGPADDRNEADAGICEGCGKPVCFEHEHARWEDVTMCSICGEMAAMQLDGNNPELGIQDDGNGSFIFD